MRRRPPAALACLCGLIVVCGGWSSLWAQAPQLVSAAARQVAGGKNYDIALPLAGGSGIECRVVTNGMTVVLTFDKPVSAGNAAVIGNANLNGAPTFTGSTMTIRLAGVANQQELTISATNVSAGAGDAANVSVKVRTLLGDVNSNGTVSGADVNMVSAQVGAAAFGGNLRCDVNLSDAISGADVNIVRSQVGKAVAGGASANGTPTISDITNQTGESGLATPAIGFAVADAETPADSLAVSAKSSNPSLVPVANILFGGSGGNRTLSLTPALGQTGSATITITVSDGLATASDSFNITVTAPTKLFVTQMRPQAGTITQGSGTSTLRMAGDEMSAVVRFDYSNLTSAKVGAHIHGPADPIADTNAGILFDLDENQLEDGSFLWTFPSDPEARQQLVNWIKNGQTYINVHSSNYPNGEIKGFYTLATGSIEFKKPADPPPLPGGPPTQQDAARFLIQATYGPTEAEIANVQSIGFDAWLDQQTATPATLLRPTIEARVAAGEVLATTQLWEAWWKASLAGPDQLRQRMAFALSQIFVVSQNSSVLNGQPLSVAHYYDLLLNDAFGNFRQLLEDVTLNPAMGLYLDMRNNRKETATRIPNENYAREVLQLFSIGVNHLHPDGTLKLNQFGLPIATYDQAVIVGFARTFTGWNWHQPGPTIVINPPANYFDAMTCIPTYHENRLMAGQSYSKLLLNGVTLPANRTGEQDLKDALDNIFNHPNTGPFTCRQLIQRFVTSSPSPGYIYRVARVFDGYRQGDVDGAPSALRGDLGAVVKAILTDYEARSTTLINNPGYGKLKEPLLRNTAVIRAFDPVSTSGHWRIGATDAALAQTPMRAPTVFNFFEPNYVKPGEIAEAGLVSPEFQITSETTAISSANFVRDGIYNGWQSGYRDIRINLTAEKALSSNPSAMVDRIALLLMAGNLPPAMKTIVVNHVNTIGPADPTGRARAAVHLIATSPQCCTQK